MSINLYSSGKIQYNLPNIFNACLNACSVAMWVKANNSNSDGHSYFMRGTTFSSDALGLNQAGANWQEAVFSVGGQIAANAQFGKDLSIWRFICGTWDKSISGGLLQLFFEGIETTYATQNSKTTSVAYSTALPISQSTNITAGIFTRNIHVYNRKITPAEQLQIMIYPSSVIRNLIYFNPVNHNFDDAVILGTFKYSNSEPTKTLKFNRIYNRTVYSIPSTVATITAGRLERIQQLGGIQQLIL